MNRLMRHSALALGLLAGTLASPLHAAVTLTDAFSGNWRDADRPNRGWDIDVLTRNDGSKVLFLYSATYDAAGKPFWITSNFEIKEFENSWTAKPFGTFEGGSFAGSENPTGRLLGTLNVSVESCGEVNVRLTPDAASGLPAVSQRLIPSQELASGVAQKGPRCVYEKKFTACPAGTTAGTTARSCVLPNAITTDLTLTNDTTWVINGLVRVGGDNTNRAVLTIEPGTLLVGNGNTSDYLYVQPGSRIIAEGKAYAPIIFTSADDGVASDRSPAPKDWGGVVLSGNAPNNKCAAAPFDCRSEFDPNLRYGGNDPHDSSGILRYVQVRYAGYVFAEGREVNAFTFQSVGDGTVLEYLQAYRGGDDGFEFFGGTVNGRYLVVTEGGDDSFDWDEGWSGKLQFLLSKAGSGLGEDNGFESSNQAQNQDALPRATPTIANFTFLGSATAGDGMHLKEGTGGRFVNGIVRGFDRNGKACLAMFGAPTFAAAGTPAALSGTLTIDRTFLNCAAAYRQDAAAPWTPEAFFLAQTGNSVADVQLQGVMPAATSPARNSGRLLGDAFFAPAPYSGAFSTSAGDWTRAWTFRPY
jgi:hypothetical protein